MLALDESKSGLVACTVESVKQVMPFPVNIEAPHVSGEHSLHTELCVLVGVAGDISGRLLIDGRLDTFGKLGASMFGMALEGEMLRSFVGEIANMVAGNMCTFISQSGKKVDITPPTILEGEIQLFGFKQAVVVPMAIESIGDMNIILLLNEEKAG